MTNVIDFAAHLDARVYRLFQAEALLELYRRNNGRDAVDLYDLESWHKSADLSAYGDPIDPTKVFGRAEAAAVLARISN